MNIRKRNVKQESHGSFFFQKCTNWRSVRNLNKWEIVEFMMYQQCNKHLLRNKSQADKCFFQQVIPILLYKLKHEQDLRPSQNYGYVGTWPPFYVDFYPTLGCHEMCIKLWHWGVMKCVLSFEVWYPCNQQVYINGWFDDFSWTWSGF